jgi:hypothetical protein
MTLHGQALASPVHAYADAASRHFVEQLAPDPATRASPLFTAPPTHTRVQTATPMLGHVASPPLATNALLPPALSSSPRSRTPCTARRVIKRPGPPLARPARHQNPLPPPSHLPSGEELSSSLLLVRLLDVVGSRRSTVKVDVAATPATLPFFTSGYFPFVLLLMRISARPRSPGVRRRRTPPCPSSSTPHRSDRDCRRCTPAFLSLYVSLEASTCPSSNALHFSPQIGPPATCS